MATDEFGGISIEQPSSVDEFGGVAVSPNVGGRDLTSIPRGGTGVPLPADQASKTAAQRIVARERELGFRPGDLILKSEAQQIADQAGIPLGDVGEVASTAQFEPGLRGDLMRLGVGARELASQALFGIPGAAQSVLEDAILNEAQKAVFGSQSLKSRAPEYAIAGGTLGQLVPSGLVGSSIARSAPLAQRLLAGARTGAGVGGTTSASGAIEEGGLNTDLQDLLTKTAIGTTLGAGLGTALPASQAALSGIRSALRGNAERNVAQGLLGGGGTQEAKRIVERITPEILDRPMTETFALTRKGLAEKSEAQKQLAGEAIEAFGTLKGDINPQQIVLSLEKLKSPYIVEGNIIDQAAIDRIQSIQDVFNQFGNLENSISKEGLRQIRRTFDSQVASSKGFFKDLNDSSILELKKTASNEIRRILAHGEPDLVKLNSGYNFFSNLSDVATKTAERTKPQMGFVPTLATVAGAASGTGLADIAVRAVLFRGVAQAARSPGWKLLSARVKNNIADGLTSANPETAINALKGYDANLAGRLSNELEQIIKADKDGDIDTLTSFSEGFQQEIPVE